MFVRWKELSQCCSLSLTVRQQILCSSHFYYGCKHTKYNAAYRETSEGEQELWRERQQSELVCRRADSLI